MSLPNTPHDALFRALVSNPRRAGALLADYLPREVAGLLGPDTPPEAMEGSFVDADASRTQCDALFRVRLRTGHDARIYVLLEHKSFVDATVPLQILKYMVNIWQREFERHILRYIVERMNLTLPMLEASLRRTKPDRWEALMGTVAEAWIEQGRAEGIEKGLAEGIEKGLAQGFEKGQAGLLLRQLERRFGALPEAVRQRVRDASASELEAWAEAVLDAASLDEVLAAGSQR